MHKSFAAAEPRIKLWINQKKWMILATLRLTFSAFAAFVVLRWPFSQQRMVRSLQETFPATVTFQNFLRPNFGQRKSSVELRRGFPQRTASR